MARHGHWTKGVLVMFFMAIAPAFAKNSRNLSFASPATLNGTPIPAGDYQVTWQTHSPEATVTIANGKRLVIAANGRWEERNIAYESSAVVYDMKSDGSRAIVEIRFAGLRGALVFGESSQ